jgi:hypothetical protein
LLSPVLFKVFSTYSIDIRLLSKCQVGVVKNRIIFPKLSILDHMSWLSRTSQVKPFPVPFQNRDPIPMFPLEEDPKGISNVDYLMNQEQADEQERMHPEMSYLNQGNKGIVYETENSVIKYTSDVKEMDAALRLYEVPLSCAVRVLSPPVKITEDLVKLELEKVEPLSNEEIRVIDAFHFVFRQGRKPDNLTVGLEYPELLAEFRGLRECLRSYGFRLVDVHGDNVGRNANGDMVLLDLGYTTD